MASTELVCVNINDFIRLVATFAPMVSLVRTFGQGILDAAMADQDSVQLFGDILENVSCLDQILEECGVRANDTEELINLVNTNNAVQQPTGIDQCCKALDDQRVYVSAMFARVMGNKKKERKLRASLAHLAEMDACVTDSLFYTPFEADQELAGILAPRKPSKEKMKVDGVDGDGVDGVGADVAPPAVSESNHAHYRLGEQTFSL
jgi:hypothetical protein